MSYGEKKLNKLINKQLILSLLLTLGFVIGVPFIIFGASKKIVFLLVLGIVFSVLGFYVMPISWVFYGNKKSLKATFYAITKEKIFNLNKLSLHLGKNTNLIKEEILQLIKLQCLIGYSLDENGNIIKNEIFDETINLGKCPHCNAPLTYQNKEIVCPYCGVIINKKIDN